MRGWAIAAAAVVRPLALCRGSRWVSADGSLNPNDCICMNSVDGRVMADETSGCCRDMGLRAANNVCCLDLAITLLWDPFRIGLVAVQKLTLIIEMRSRRGRPPDL